jgi:acetylglutamate kinase
MTEHAMEKARILIEALPYIRSFYGKTFVIKYGGSAQTLDELKHAFAQDIVLLDFIGIRPIVVHGGGPRISEMMKRMGKEPCFVHGHRVTDEETMDIVEMVLGGLVGKEIVSLINSHGGRAVGLSGKDGGMIQARRKQILSPQDQALIDIGLVGEVTKVQPGVLETLERGGFIPVIAPVGVGPLGETFNINGDDITASIAEAVKAEKLIYLTDVEGIRDREGRAIPTLNASRARAMMGEGTIAGGMIPKASAALRALEGGVRKTHIIDGRIPHCLLLEIFTETGIGTEIVLDGA